jgi:hypothetical protein
MLAFTDVLGESFCSKTASPSYAVFIISIMYSIWSSRNRITHDGEKFDPYQSLKKIKEELYMLEFQGNIRKSRPRLDKN